MKTIILPIKKKWFDLILSGVKKEEYREIKPYYDRRFKDLVSSGEQFEAFFRNGYCAKSPSFVAICTVDIGTGEPSWGAVEGVKYYRIAIREITIVSPVETKAKGTESGQISLF